MSVEFTIVEKCTPNLEGAGLVEDSNLVYFLNEKGFLTRQDCEEILNPTSSLKIASMLVKLIRDRVQEEPTSYYTLFQRLKGGGERYQQIVKELEKCHGQLQVKQG
jgi:hypothetical protein